MTTPWNPNATDQDYLGDEPSPRPTEVRQVPDPTAGPRVGITILRPFDVKGQLRIRRHQGTQIRVKLSTAYRVISVEEARDLHALLASALEEITAEREKAIQDLRETLKPGAAMTTLALWRLRWWHTLDKVRTWVSPRCSFPPCGGTGYVVAETWTPGKSVERRIVACPRCHGTRRPS